MEHPNSTRFETEVSALVKLFKDGEFPEAKEAADELLQAGYDIRLIRYSLFDLFDVLEQEKAKEAACAFIEYGLDYWLPKEQRQQILNNQFNNNYHGRH